MKGSKPIPVLVPLLMFVAALFIGLLIYTYVETRKANPKMLDEKGRPASASALARHLPIRV